jgi:DNA helicase INO80
MVNKIITEIDSAEKSDVEAAGFEKERERYLARGKKRLRDVDRAEGIKRKVWSRIAAQSCATLTQFVAPPS